MTRPRHARALPVLIFFLVLPAQAQSLDAATMTRFTDFTEPDAARRWQTVNDDVMGGRSTGGPTFTGETLVFSGVLNTNGGGFSSVRRDAGEADWGAAEGVRLRVRGDGRTYQFEVRTGERDRGIPLSYRAPFETPPDGSWQEVFVPFSDFRASAHGRRVPRARLDPAQTRGIGLFLEDGQDGPFELEVDWIELGRR